MKIGVDFVLKIEVRAKSERSPVTGSLNFLRKLLKNVIVLSKRFSFPSEKKTAFINSFKACVILYR